MATLNLSDDRVKVSEWDFTTLKTVIRINLFAEDVQKIDNLLKQHNSKNEANPTKRARFIRQLVREALTKYDSVQS